MYDTMIHRSFVHFQLHKRKYVKRNSEFMVFHTTLPGSFCEEVINMSLIIYLIPPLCITRTHSVRRWWLITSAWMQPSYSYHHQEHRAARNIMAAKAQRPTRHLPSYARPTAASENRRASIVQDDRTYKAVSQQPLPRLGSSLLTTPPKSHVLQRYMLPTA